MGEVHSASFGRSLLDQPTDTVVDMLTSPEYFRFGFVRNPYSRLVSAWMSKLAWENDGYEDVREAVREAFDYPTVDGRRVGTVSFRDSVELLLDPSTASLFDPHWHRQVDVLMVDVTELDFVGRFENFATDFSTVLERLGAPPHVSELATTVTDATTPIPLSAAYDSDLASRVHDHYLADFERYGYNEHSWRLG